MNKRFQPGAKNMKNTLKTMPAVELIKWTSTVILTIGTLVNALGYYPVGPLILMVGGFGWLAAAIKCKDNALIAVNLIMTLVAIGGMIYHYIA